MHFRVDCLSPFSNYKFLRFLQKFIYLFMDSMGESKGFPTVSPCSSVTAAPENQEIYRCKHKHTLTPT